LDTSETDMLEIVLSSVVHEKRTISNGNIQI
jgi:hypothetical protein